jgi:hypothetical protein
MIAFALLLQMVADQMNSSQPPLATANAAQSLANHASIGTAQIANASATILDLHANQTSTGIRKNVLASVLTKLDVTKINTLIMILARANVAQKLKMISLPFLKIQELNITGVPLLSMEFAIGDVTLLTSAVRINTSMTLNANVSAHHISVAT